MRDNRYGIFGDNGYAELVEIKKRELTEPEPRPKEERPVLTREGMVQIISKIKDYHDAKEQQIKQAVIKGIMDQQQARAVVNQVAEF